MLTASLLLSLTAAGCHDPSRGGSTGAIDAGHPDTPAPAPPATASAAAVEGGDPTVRRRGDVRGRITADKARYALGEPMLVDVEVTNAGSAPLTFDDRAARYIWIVRDEAGALLCDVGGASSRLGSEFAATIHLAPGEINRETRLLNTACVAFTRAGRYRVSILRVLSDARAMAPRRACEDLVERRPAAAQASAAEATGERDCALELAPFPAIAADLLVELTPWDASALRARVAQLSGERATAARAGDLSREGALTSYGGWFCDHVRCDCAPLWNRNGDWFARALSRVPDAMPGACR